MVPVDNKPQTVGGCITYARRYGILAILGLAPEDEDDDGNTASGRDATKATPKATPQQWDDAAMKSLHEDINSLMEKADKETADKATKILQEAKSTTDLVKLRDGLRRKIG